MKNLILTVILLTTMVSCAVQPNKEIAEIKAGQVAMAEQFDKELLTIHETLLKITEATGKGFIDAGAVFELMETRLEALEATKHTNW